MANLKLGPIMKKMSKNRAIRTASILSIAVATVFTSSPATAHAQEYDQATADYGDIVVTARKRSEDLLKTPVAISAVNSEMLDKQGIASVADLSTSTPSMNLNNNNSGRNDRSFQQIIIRGFVPSNAQNPTTSTFIDGVPVSSPTAFNAISDPERIEVLRGPQSAYFGRNTFAGAMNVVTKEPGDEFAGSASIMVGTRGTYRVQGSIEGPILGEDLTFRIGAGENSKNGSYKNAFAGGTLGDQKTRFVSGTIVAKPVEGLKIKATGLFSQDRDGAPANGLISAYDLRASQLVEVPAEGGGTKIVAQEDPNGAIVVKGQSNCSFTVGGNINPYMCGTVRNLSVRPSANVHMDSRTRDFLSNPNGRLMPSLQEYGLHRDFYHLHLNMSYDLGDSGFTLSSLTGMNREKYGQFSEMENYGSVAILNGPGANNHFDYAWVVERKNSDFSQEVRLAFDNGGPLEGTVGLSYLNNWTQGSNGSPAVTGRVTPAGVARSRTKGAFFGLSYKPTSQLTLNAEGRYQSDTLYAYARPGGQVFTSSAIIPAGRYEEGDTLLKRTYNNFLPRVIAQYEFGPEAMVYASWAKGVNPGQFNTGFLARSQEAIDDAGTRGFRVEVSPEKVTNYELGVKGRLLDRRLNYSLSAYFAQWRDQANLISYYYQHVPQPGVDTPADEQMNGQLNTGAVDMKGIELDLGYRASDLVTFGFSGSFNDSKIKAYSSPTVTALTGITDYSGNEMPFTSKWSANANVEFHGDIVGHDDATWFVRTDYLFKSGVWSNAANIVKTADIHKVNARAGVARGPISIDIFVTNLFNNKSFTSIGDNWLYSPALPGQTSLPYGSTHSALVVGLAEKRTGGLQLKYKF